MKVVNIEAMVRVMVGSIAVTDFEKVEYVYKPTQSQQRTGFKALEDMATLVFKERINGKFRLRIANNEGATYPSDWDTRQKGLREKIEAATFENTTHSRGSEMDWSLQFENIKALVVDTEVTQGQTA